MLTDRASFPPAFPVFSTSLLTLLHSPLVIFPSPHTPPSRRGRLFTLKEADDAAADVLLLRLCNLDRF